MSAVIDAKRTMRELGTKAAAIRDDSTKTIAERMTALDQITTDLKSASDLIAMHEKANSLVGGGESTVEAKTGSRGPMTLGRTIVTSDAFKSAQGSIGTRFSYASETKAADVVDEGIAVANGQLNGASGVLALPDYQPGIVDIKFAQLSVAQLFAQGATNSPIISYVKEASQTIGAKSRAERTAGGQADSKFVRVNEQVGSISVFEKLTNEMLEDVTTVESFLTSRLTGQISREEENEVLNGAGYPALGGILGRAGLQPSLALSGVVQVSDVVDGLYKQVTAIRTTAFMEPDAIVMNPLDWQNIRLGKDKNGQYLAGGPFFGAYGQGTYSNVSSLWGLRVVESPRIAPGKALVGCFSEGGQLFQRAGIVTEMTNSNEDDFKNLLVTVRATKRSALAVYYPGAFGTADIAWS